MSRYKILINNKKSNFNYQFSDKYIAGLVLRGTEIKSIKDSSVNFLNSYCIINNDEIYLKGMVINEYIYGNINNHQTDRDRKLLLNKIDKALRKIEEGTYGYCEETNQPISIARLKARPIATLSLEAQEMHEKFEKIYKEKENYFLRILQLIFDL